MSKRDPRIEPKPGDVVKVRNEARTVIELFPNGLRWKSFWSENNCMFRTWQRWAKGAEVVTKAEVRNG